MKRKRQIRPNGETEQAGVIPQPSWSNENQFGMIQLQLEDDLWGDWAHIRTNSQLRWKVSVNEPALTPA